MERIMSVFLGFLVGVFFMQGTVISKFFQGFVEEAFEVLFSIFGNLCVIGFGLVIVLYAFKNSKDIVKGFIRRND